MRLLAVTTTVVALAGGALLGGVIDEGGASAAPSIEAQRAATRGLTLQQQARVSGNPALYPRAERALSEALRLDPGNASAIRGLSALAASRHRFQESLVLAKRARALEPEVAAVYGLIGDASLELGRYREAFAAFDRMAALKPSTNAYARISYARELTGDLPGALAAMELAVDAAGGGARVAAGGGARAALRGERRPQPPRDGRVRPEPRPQLPLRPRARAARACRAAERGRRPRARLGPLQERPLRRGPHGVAALAAA